MNDQLALVLFSGAADKLMAAASIAAGAAASGRRVSVFLTFAGLLAFRKDHWKTNQTVSADQEPYRETVRQALQASQFPSWLQVFQDAAEIGNLQITACLMSLELFNLTLDALEPIVAGTASVNDFLAAGRGGHLLFI